MTDDDRGAQEEEELELEDANVFDTETRTQISVDEATARCRRCQWDSPEAWLVQSDSIDEEVSVASAAMV
jgi:L-ribulose-5-phosphate 3-epimerase UlaE